MALRIYIYSNLVALVLVALAAYLDRTGFPTSPMSLCGVVFVAWLPLLPLVLFAVLGFARLPLRQKLYGAIVGVSIWAAQIIAALPLVQ